MSADHLQKLLLQKKTHKYVKETHEYVKEIHTSKIVQERFLFVIAIRSIIAVWVSFTYVWVSFTYLWVSFTYLCVFFCNSNTQDGVATISRLLKIIGLFCIRALLKRLYSAKKTHNFKEPTNRSHPIL